MAERNTEAFERLAMLLDHELVAVIDAEARKVLPADLISHVTVKRDVGHDGDPIVWVNVMVDRRFMDLDPNLTIPFGRALVSTLWAADEQAAPVLRYVVSGKDRKRDDAAA